MKEEKLDSWVSVEDRLPEVGLSNEPVAIYIAFDGYAVVGYYSDESEFCREWYGDGTYNSKIYNVTHWCPLPKPPVSR